MEGSDVVLTVGDAKFYAHRAVSSLHHGCLLAVLLQILSAFSPVFRAMFNGEFREKEAAEIPIIVDGIEARHVEPFLQGLYSFGIPPYGIDIFNSM